MATIGTSPSAFEALREGHPPVRTDVVDEAPLVECPAGGEAVLLIARPDGRNRGNSPCEDDPLIWPDDHPFRFALAAGQPRHSCGPREPVRVAFGREILRRRKAVGAIRSAAGAGPKPRDPLVHATRTPMPARSNGSRSALGARSSSNPGANVLPHDAYLPPAALL